MTLEPTSWADVPARHEAGTPNLVGAVALATACRYLDAFPEGAIRSHEAVLLAQLDDGLAEVGRPYTGCGRTAPTGSLSSRSPWTGCPAALGILRAGGAMWTYDADHQPVHDARELPDWVQAPVSL